MRRALNWVQSTSELLANEIFPMKEGSVFRDVGWVAVVNAIDFSLASFVFGLGMAMFLNAIALVSYAQEPNHIQSPAAPPGLPTGTVTVLSMLIMLIHAILREVVSPILKARTERRQTQPVPIALNRELLEYKILEERLKNQQEKMDDLEERFMVDIKRLFELHDERRNRR